MARLVPEQHTKRVFLVLGKERKCFLGEDIGDVAFLLHGFAIDIQDRIVVNALPLEAEPVVKPQPGLVMVLHVPFADQRGFVADLLQSLRKLLQVGLGVLNLIVAHSVDVRISASQYGRATRGAHGQGDEHVVEHRPFFLEAVQVGRFQKGKTVAEQRVRSHVVDHHKQDVGFFRGPRCRTRQKQQRSRCSTYYLHFFGSPHN
jgi:hypothetical protein